MEFSAKDLIVCICFLGLLPGISTFFTCKTETWPIRCGGWYKLTRADVECEKVLDDGLVLDCTVKYGCKSGIVMGQLRLCKEKPTFSVYADVYDLGVYQRRSDVTTATVNLSKIGVLDIKLDPTSNSGEGELTVKLGKKVLYRDIIKDPDCDRKVRISRFLS